MAIIGKKDLTKQIAISLNLKEKEVREVLDKTIDLIVENVKKGNEVRLLGFGSFKEKIVDRDAVIPSTKEKKRIKYKTIKFKASDKLKEEF